MDAQDLVVIAYIYICHFSCSSADGCSRPGGNCIYISHSSCSSADGCSRPGGNCIYISHSSCSSADGCSRPEMTLKSVMLCPTMANCRGSKYELPCSRHRPMLGQMTSKFFGGQIKDFLEGLDLFFSIRLR